MKLLLHACCGPCSLEPVRLLALDGHDITIMFANPNIQPRGEYDHRLQVLRDWALQEGIPVVEAAYDDCAWREQVGSIQEAGKPREERCRACYALRLEQAGAYAAAHGFQALSTTLAVSPYQFSEACHEELQAVCERHGLACVWYDFRPYYPDATIRSRALGMYRQNYCGCLYSKAEADQEREERRALKQAQRVEREERDQKVRRERAAQQAAYDAKQARKRRMRDEARAAARSAAAMGTDPLAPAAQNEAPSPAYDTSAHALRTADFDYALPEERIAQEPWPVRDECKLLVVDRTSGAVSDRIFRDVLDYIRPGDVLVANETRVRPARLIGAKRATGGVAEVFLLREVLGKEEHTAHSALWEVLVRPGKRLKPGAIVDFGADPDNPVLSAEIVDFAHDGKGERVARLTTPLPSLDEAFHCVGKTPLPPYIKDYVGDDEMYQTVYSTHENSAAAPTAGLHFTPELIEAVRRAGAAWETVELQVGIDTFRIVEEERPVDHDMHTETYTVPQRVVDACNRAHEQGGRVIAVGTTSVRSLESAWDTQAGCLQARANASTSLFLLPGSTFHVVDGLITNFHVPRSTLMMLVSAFSSRDIIMNAYQHALDNGYRFLSFGDAMFIHEA